jgi:hypothetical protein
VHLSEAGQRRRIGAGRRRVEERLEIVVGVDVMRGRELRRAREQSLFSRVSANGRQCCEMSERA